MINKPIFLIGMMGSGKSSLASALTNELSIPLLDTDQAIEKAVGLTVSEIFSQNGEVFFRSKEKELISSLTSEPKIVACGGGLPCQHQLIDFLLEKGHVIYLKAPADLLYQRIQESQSRPLLADLKHFERLLRHREACYTKANYVLDATKTEQAVLSDCLQLLSTDLS